MGNMVVNRTAVIVTGPSFSGMSQIAMQCVVVMVMQCSVFSQQPVCRPILTTHTRSAGQSMLDRHCQKRMSRARITVHVDYQRRHAAANCCWIGADLQNRSVPDLIDCGLVIVQYQYQDRFELYRQLSTLDGLLCASSSAPQKITGWHSLATLHPKMWLVCSFSRGHVCHLPVSMQCCRVCLPSTTTVVELLGFVFSFSSFFRFCAMR